DAQGNVAEGYTGTVHFTSTASGALPDDYTFTAADSGVHTFSGVILYTAGAQTLTAQDTSTSSITGSTTVNVTALPASQFVVAAPEIAVAGKPFDVTVMALDPYGNVDIGYSGTVTITSLDRDPRPFDYTFTPDDKGTHVFSVSLFTAGSQTILVRDTANSL